MDKNKSRFVCVTYERYGSKTHETARYSTLSIDCLKNHINRIIKKYFFDSQDSPPITLLLYFGDGYQLSDKQELTLDMLDNYDKRYSVLELGPIFNISLKGDRMLRRHVFLKNDFIRAVYKTNKKYTNRSKKELKDAIRNKKLDMNSRFNTKKSLRRKLMEYEVSSKFWKSKQ